MDRPFITLGDKTSHGGTVISADLTCSINGKYMARVGDKVVCPQCKGVFAINSGAPDMVDGEGRSYARHMDTTDCGASLISGEATTAWSDESSLGDPAADAKAEALATASRVAAPTDSGICLDCLRKAAHFGSPTVIRE
ncbi:PAAR domain-containing protein [Herbaspirillum sp. BH-1]|uniref:Zn-binding protein involved in type VI secretion n=1 Tax=Herbaspirillum frisingense TaxID=92645 RepID=A0ABU1PBE8_9BURK|nr:MULTISPECIES: PAAR domain-containing protein [Herbaspirillum]MDR6582673.1 putative Zn-binding protein involved in type VI secretion [Herbaspirillum frisingense]PLY58142.1 PAAR domain-containing protein [Herbaspirillum sp. BH-1]